MKRSYFILGLTTLIVVLAWSAWAGEATWQERWDSTVAKAKNEGGLLFYVVIMPEARAELAKAFTERFGIKVEYMAIGTGVELTRKISTERRAGLFLSDGIFAGAAAQVTVIKPEGFLQPLAPLLMLPEVMDKNVWIGGKLPFVDKDGTLIGYIATAEIAVMRNRDLVKDGEIKSYKDLLDPKWKGKIIMLDPTLAGPTQTWGAYLIKNAWNMEQTKEYFRGLVKQEPVLTRDRLQVVELTARGKYAIGIGANPETVGQFMDVGAPVAPIKTIEGYSISPAVGMLSIPTQLAHPNAAAVFLNWFLTKEGQTAMVKGFKQPSARLDVAPTGVNQLFLVKAGEKAVMQTEEELSLTVQVRDMAKEVFSPLLK